jgi:HYR domain
MNARNANPRFLPNRKVAWKIVGALTLLVSSVTGAVITKGGARTPDQGVNNAFIAAGGQARDVLVNGSYIYWVLRNERRIGRANIDGTGVNPNFIVLPGDNEPGQFGGTPGGITTDGTHLYWTIESDEASVVGFVSKATLDGALVSRQLVRTGRRPVGIAAANGQLYWANTDDNSIGTASVDGNGLNQSLVTNSVQPYGVEVAGGFIYYANFGNGKSIGRASLDGATQDPNFIITTAAAPVNAQGVTGLTIDSTYLYWANYISGSNSTIGRYRLDGSAAPDNTFLKGLDTNSVKAPVGLAVTSTNLYWTSFEPATIGRTEFDTDAPIVTVAPVTALATGVDSVITYPTPVSATDVNDDAANITITCDRGTPTGGTFPVGVTTVSCSAKDAVGNTSAAKTFTVTVTKPANPPALNLPASQSVQATDPTGAIVTYLPATSPAGTPTCAPASGTLFKVGVTSVECKVTDAFGQSTTGTFQVTVTLPGGPKISVPADQTITATSPAGAKVDYPAATSVAGTVTCSPASGSTFVIGTTAVTCSVIDSFGQVGTGNFKVTVAPPGAPVIKVPALVEVLIDAPSAVAKFDTPTSAAGTPTCSKVSGAVFPAGTTTVTCKVTDAFGQVGTATFQVVVRPPVFIPIVQVLPDTTTTTPTIPPTTAAPTTAAPTTAAPTTVAPAVVAAPATPIEATPQVEVAGVTVTPEEAPAATAVNLEPSFAG